MTHYHNIFIIPLIGIMIVLYLYFVGFIGYFVEEVIDNPNNPPQHNFKKILKTGLNEAIFFSFYIALTALTYGIFIMIGQYYSTYEEQINIIKILITSFLSIFPMAAMVNVFLHDKKVIHGFKIKEIAELIFNLRTSKFIGLFYFL